MLSIQNEPKNILSIENSKVQQQEDFLNRKQDEDQLNTLKKGMDEPNVLNRYYEEILEQTIQQYEDLTLTKKCP